MSQTHNCQCQDDITMIPIHGLQIGIQSDLLKKYDCDGSGGGRIRVTEDLHIYIDGKRTESGNGLTPETAVASYEDAVDVASRYDGCNKWNVYFHFADLAAGEMYPALTIAGSDHTSFAFAYLRGESYLTTKFLKITFARNCFADLQEVYAACLVADRFSSLTVSGNVSLQGNTSQDFGYGLAINNSSVCVLNAESNIYIQGGMYGSAFLVNTQCIASFLGKITIAKPMTAAWAFVAVRSGFLAATSTTIITQAAVTGSRYMVYNSGVIDTGGRGANFFPGTSVGTAGTGGVYM